MGSLQPNLLVEVPLLATGFQHSRRFQADPLYRKTSFALKPIQRHRRSIQRCLWTWYQADQAIGRVHVHRREQPHNRGMSRILDRVSPMLSALTYAPDSPHCKIWDGTQSMGYLHVISKGTWIHCQVHSIPLPYGPYVIKTGNLFDEEDFGR